MRLPFSPIITGTFLAITFLIAAYFMMGGAAKPDKWGDVKTQDETEKSGESERNSGTGQSDAADSDTKSKSGSDQKEKDSDETKTFSVVVTFNGGPFTKGQIVAGLFDNATDFRNRSSPIQSCFLKVAGTNDYKWEFKNVPVGTYAISAYLDENGNSTLDKGSFGIPKEKYGFSNNARGQLGPPSFKAASFELSGKEPIVILLK